MNCILWNFIAVDNLKTNLENIKTESSGLRNDGTSLQNAFTGIKSDLQIAKGQCGGDSACESTIEGYKTKVQMDVNFDDLPDIQSSLDDVDEVYNLNISKNVAEVC